MSDRGIEIGGKVMELSAIIKRWKVRLCGDSDINDIQNEIIKDKLLLIEKEAIELLKTAGTSLWGDILWDKSADLTTAYNRVFKMALAYGSFGTALYKSEELKEKILYSLNWLYENRYGEKELAHDPTGWRDINLFNWWDWDLGAPGFLIDTLVIMADEIDADTIAKYLKLFDTLVPAPRDYGANKIHFATLVIGSALLKNDAKKISETFEDIKEMFEYCDGEDVWMQHKQPGNNGQGFYSDGTYIFHTKHLMNGTYGIIFYEQALNLYLLTKKTHFEFPESIGQKIKLWYKISFMNFVHYGKMNRAVMGRKPNDIESIAQKIVWCGLDVLQVFGEDEEIKRFIAENIKYIDSDNSGCSIRNVKYLEGIINSDMENLEFSKVYYFADKVLHKKKNYTFTLSMSSAHIFNYECINNENLTGWYISDGMTGIYSENNSYGSEYWENVNPYYIPGTTVDTQKREAVSIRQSNEYLSEEDFCGGVVFDDRYVTASMSLRSYHSDGNFFEKEIYPNQPIEYGCAPPKHNCSLKAKKAWFCFDDEIIALGAGICAQDGFDVLTVIENLPNDMAEEKEKSFTVKDVAKYVILDNKEIEYKKDNFNIALINHGKNPKDETYAYAILPGESIKESKSEILSNTEKIQAVRCGNITGIVFYEAGEFCGVSVNAPCIVMFDENHLSVAEPTHKQNSINIRFKDKEYTINPQYGESISLYDENFSETILTIE